jgi:DNA-binding response OmpR family regulator
MYAFFLKHSGFVVSEAATAYDALRAIDDNPPDLVVTDLSLPGVGGLDLCRELRQHEHLEATPVIALSMAPLNEVELERAIDAGSDVILPMPCLPDTLLFEIRKALQRCTELRDRSRAMRERAGVLSDKSNRLQIKSIELQERCHRLLTALSQEHLIDCIKETFERAPSMAVTVEQAQLLWSTDRVACRLALRCLADAGWLDETPSHLYIRRS